VGCSLPDAASAAPRKDIFRGATPPDPLRLVAEVGWLSAGQGWVLPVTKVLLLPWLGGYLQVRGGFHPLPKCCFCHLLGEA
jgi:hypothetical protein